MHYGQKNTVENRIYSLRILWVAKYIAPIVMANIAPLNLSFFFLFVWFNKYVFLCTYLLQKRTLLHNNDEREEYNE